MRKLILLTILCFFSNVSFSQECIKGNCNNGSGTFTWPNGDKFVGTFKNGKGSQGTFFWADGRIYIGTMKDGVLTGEGTFTIPKGIVYVGEFKNGMMHGQGIFITHFVKSRKKSENLLYIALSDLTPLEY